MVIHASISNTGAGAGEGEGVGAGLGEGEGDGEGEGLGVGAPAGCPEEVRPCGAPELAGVPHPDMTTQAIRISTTMGKTRMPALRREDKFWNCA